jgi:predicted metal-binding membrane protein
MWTTMMVGMMLPPEVPTLIRLAGDGRSERWRAAGSASALLGGYLGVWVLASAALAGLDAWLAARGLMTHEMASRSVPLSVAILAAAGLVQLSPWKTACLARCRSLPAELSGKVSELSGKVSSGKVSSGKVSNTFLDDAARPVRYGLRHGLASVSSCGVLMLVLLVVGAMNWLAMAALTGFLVVERLAPASVAPLVGRISGLGLLIWGGWLVTSTVAG